ncbi:type II toxin-antitoxin system HicB family antitoxin [Scytonema sp. NUACC26]|uniref:type II toxin-antitoxin system HicB family antitoxin n=1 Tax=Scytonema sp. NUACC26 TaxID=3140176 RepID=UPI0034DCB4F5
MNLQSVANLNKLPLHIIVERLDSGHFIASVSELADCVAEAENREDAIASLEEKIKARLANIEILTKFQIIPGQILLVCLREMRSLQSLQRNCGQSAS